MAKTKQKLRKNSGTSKLSGIGLMDRVKLVEQSLLRNDFPHFKAGDTLRVHVKIKEGEKERVQPYEGLCIARRNMMGGKSFIVRKVSHGVGVERIFMETSTKVSKIELIQEGKVRRAKLYYVRELEGKAARIEREVETLAAQAASAAAKGTESKPAKK